MKTLTRLTFASVAALLFSMNADLASAQSFGHVDKLATKLQGQSYEIYNEFRVHYRHSTHYKSLMSDAARVYNEAKHIHELVHRGSVTHLSQDLKDVDRAYHHLEELMRHVEHDARHGTGHVDDRIGHVKKLMAQMKISILHLREDINKVLPRRSHEVHYDDSYRYERRSRRSNRGHRGRLRISIRRGGVRIGRH